MKGITGIVVAIGLGIAGALANLFYLHSEAQKVETVSFIGVKKASTAASGCWKTTSWKSRSRWTTYGTSSNTRTNGKR